MYLEVIHLCRAGDSLDDLCDQIRDSVSDDHDLAGNIRFFQHKGLVTDLAIHIYHHGVSGDEIPSDIGLRIAASLKTYGLVKHSVWKELG